MSGHSHRRALASSSNWKWQVTDETFLYDEIGVFSLFPGEGWVTHGYLAVLRSLAHI